MEIPASLNGRCNRSKYWAALATLIVIALLLFVPQIIIYERISNTWFYVLLVVDIFYIIIALNVVAFLTIQRFNDAGIPTVLLSSLLCIAIVVGLVCRILNVLTIGVAVNSLLLLSILLCCLKNSKNTD